MCPGRGRAPGAGRLGWGGLSLTRATQRWDSAQRGGGVLETPERWKRRRRRRPRRRDARSSVGAACGKGRGPTWRGVRVRGIPRGARPALGLGHPGESWSPGGGGGSCPTRVVRPNASSSFLTLDRERHRVLFLFLFLFVCFVLILSRLLVLWVWPEFGLKTQQSKPPGGFGRI